MNQLTIVNPGVLIGKYIFPPMQFLPILVPHSYGVVCMFVGGVILMALLAVWTFIVNHRSWKNKTFLLRCLLVLIGITSIYLRK